MRPYTTALHRIVRSYVSRRPGLTSVERICDVEMPDAIETVCGTVSACRRAVEGDSGAVCIGCHRGRIKCVLYSIDFADIIDVLPREVEARTLVRSKSLRKHSAPNRKS